MKGIIAVVLVLLVSMVASAAGCNNTAKVNEGNVMIPKSIPSIDANRPVNTEIATFALG